MTSQNATRWATAWEEGTGGAPWPLPTLLSGVYRGALTTHRWLYRAGLRRAKAIECPVVSIGNISVGGTGKTPAVELAIRTLTQLGYQPAVVSRGYRRRSRGLQIVADAASIRLEPEEAGDEPFLLARRLPGVPVVVGANRADAIQLARDRFGITAVVLDDGFQHRTVMKDLEVVMARARKPWGNGQLLPSGPLREPLGALARADLVVAAGAQSVTEAPEVVNAVRRYRPGCPVLAARYVPIECWEAQRVRPVPLTQLAGARLIAFAGIASPSGFQTTLEEVGVHVEATIGFRDHHWYTERDLAGLEAQATAPGIDGLVTTEKDWVRLRTLRPGRRPVYVVSVRLDLLSGQADWLRAFEQACRKQ